MEDALFVFGGEGVDEPFVKRRLRAQVHELVEEGSAGLFALGILFFRREVPKEVGLEERFTRRVQERDILLAHIQLISTPIGNKRKEGSPPTLLTKPPKYSPLISLAAAPSASPKTLASSLSLPVYSIALIPSLEEVPAGPMRRALGKAEVYSYRERGQSRKREREADGEGRKEVLW